MRSPHSISCSSLTRAATGWPGACTLVGLFALLALSSAAQKSHTFDELAHLTAGYAYWAFDDYRLNPENGNLPQRLAGLPAWLMGAELSLAHAQRAWDSADVWLLGDTLFFRSRNPTTQMILAGRASIVVVAMLLGVLVYALARRTFGPPGAIVSLALYVFSPTVLAHGRLMTSDLMAAGFFLASVSSFGDLMRQVTPARFAASALALAGLFLCKMSAILALPMLALIALLHLLLSRDRDLRVTLGRHSWQVRSQGRRLIVALLLICLQLGVVYLAIWSSVGFRYAAFNEQRGPSGHFYAAELPAWAGHGLGGDVVRWARRHELLPESYLYGLCFVLHHARHRAAFLAGRWNSEGWWWYFPYAFFVKTPIGTLALFGLACVVIARRREALKAAEPADTIDAAVRPQRLALVPLVVLIAVYWLVLIGSSLNIGHRHLLPVYPPMFVMAGALGPWAAGASRALWQKLLVGSLVLTVAAESLVIAPNYLAYFNLFVGGPTRGWKHLVDSSLDWGQDLPALKRWIDGRRRDGYSDPIYLSYFGTSRPTHYRIEAQRLPGHVDFDRQPILHPIGKGTYCISATMLQSVYLGAASGPWTKKTEKRYRRLREQVGRLRRLKPAKRQQTLFLYDQFRFARLTAFLRQRAPSSNVSHSILVFTLSAAQARLALSGPPPYDR